MTIPFIKYSKFLLVFSSIVTTVALVFVIMWGLKPGIDFTSGSLMEMSFTTRPETARVEEVFKSLNFTHAAFQKTGDKGLIVRTDFLTEPEHQKLLTALQSNAELKNNGFREDRFETIGPSVSQQLKTRSIWAVILVNLGIIVYVAYSFRKISRPVASWKYGALAIVALVHDVLLVVGIFSFLGKYYGIEVDTAFVVAVLTVLGYSVNDTIVVYDRIRENLLRHSADNFSEVVNNGLNQTLMRSINTTVKTLLPLFALYFIGGASIHNFALALLIGIASGAYSSIFIASPLLVVVYNWQEKNKSSNGIVFSDSSLKRHLTNFYIFLSLSILSLVNLGTRHMVESRYGFNDAGFVSFLLGKIMATVSAPLAGAVITFFNLVFSFAIIWIPITVIEYRKVKKLKNLK